MAAKSSVARLVEKFVRDSIGLSTAQLQRLTEAELDTVVTLLKSGPPSIKYRVGGFYGGEGVIDTLLLTEDAEVCGPVLVEKFVRVEEIGVDVTTAGTEGNLYVTLRRDRGDGYPGALVHTSAALAVTAGFKSTTGLDLELTPGLYWAGVLNNQVTTTNATVRSLINNSPYVGETAGTNDVNTAAYQAPATETGVPPTNFSATVAVAAEAPRVMFKVKAF